MVEQGLETVVAVEFTPPEPLGDPTSAGASEVAVAAGAVVVPVVQKVQPMSISTGKHRMARYKRPMYFCTRIVVHLSF